MSWAHPALCHRMLTLQANKVLIAIGQDLGSVVLMTSMEKVHCLSSSGHQPSGWFPIVLVAFPQGGPVRWGPILHSSCFHEKGLF